jgi:uncharacterized ferritin-like protein (DUF455 family)
MIDDIGYVQVENVRLRADPAREPCFTIVYRDADMHEHDDQSEAARRENLHRHMTNEMVSLEIAAACICEFPDAPWELRLELARQCWDEARHIRVLQRRLVEVGGFKGEFPISTLEWSVTCAIDNLIGRLTTQNRTLEAGAMDVVGILARNIRATGDNETADILEGILADEVQHVRFANRWIKRLVAEDRRQLMKVASAVRFLIEANSKFQIKEGGETNAIGVKLASPEARIPAVNVEDRKLAEFSDEEIYEILRQAGFRTLVPDSVPT